MTSTAPAADSLFREAMSLLASGLAVVTAADADGAPRGLLLTSLCSYSADPPSVLVCVRRQCRSHRALVECGRFGVHLLGADQEAVAHAFAARGDGKFERVRWSWDGDIPMVEGAIAYLRCSRRAVFRHADHAIVIGELVDGSVSASDPLCYLRRSMNWRHEPR
jgi:flavin reductase (DIM6/NTAB) family NADH-FMN oxidoreductase RutF